MDVRETLEQAEAFHKSGDLARAEQCYRAVLQADPTSLHAWFLLGAVCLSTERFDEAILSFREAIRLRPEHAPTWNLLGVALGRLGRPGEAEACFLRVLQLQPGHPEAARNLERARLEQGDVANLAVAGTDFEACCRRAEAFCQQRRFAEAEAWYHEALRFRPDAADVLNDLGKVLALLSRPEEAVATFRRAIAAEPDHARAHVNLAAVLLDLNRLDEAESAARRAAQLEPENPSAHNNLGLILQKRGRPSEAERSYREGLRRAPDHPELHVNLGYVLVLQGRAALAQELFRRALERKPDFAAGHSNWLLSSQCVPGVSLSSLADAHSRWERQHAAPLRSSWRPFENDRDPERPLRLGFVSSDFQRHPVGTFVVRPLEGLRALGCEIYCYDAGSTRDDLTERITATSTVWRRARGRDDEQVAAQIRADRVDLLFDLSGHTSGNRLLVFARKPAPIQLTWMGYVGTTGLSAIDYLVADRYHVPEGTEAHYRERVIRLPDGYVCYDPPAYAPEVGPLPADSCGHVTFGCFNSPAKVGPGVVEVWAEILRRVPGSRLLLRYTGLDDEGLRGQYLDRFAAHGVDRGRVELEGGSPNAAMLAGYGRVDLALDPFPYSGGITTCEALWMGVPVVTCPGATFAGRHSLSHLSNVGLTETIASDLAQYIELAVGLADDLPRLAGLRAGLRPRMARSPLCDGDRFARNLLEAIRTAWRQWCRDWPA